MRKGLRDCGCRGMWLLYLLCGGGDWANLCREMGCRVCGDSRRVCWLGIGDRCQGMWGSSWLFGGLAMGFVWMVSTVVISVFLVQDRVEMEG